MSNYLNTPDNDWYKQRLSTTAICIMIAFIILLFRLFNLQIMQGDILRLRSENNRIKLMNIKAPRGLIFDRNGKLLAENRPSYNLNIIKKETKPIREILLKLSKYSNIPFRELNKKISKCRGVAAYKPLLLKRDLDRDIVTAIEVHKVELPGVFIRVRPHRHYIYESVAAHVVGYLSEISKTELKNNKYSGIKSGDFVGKFGVEKIFEEYLRGKHGIRQVQVNVNQQVINVLKTVEEKAGNNIYLTIDYKLQKKAEELLNGVVGAMIVMKPSTGEVLAMVSTPTFNQNDFIGGMTHKKWKSLTSNIFRPMENKAIQGEYPPASIYKIITSIAALEEGIINQNTIFECPGFYRYGNRTFLCWKYSGHGKINIKRAIAESCDVFFYQIGLKLGVDKLAWYSKACGFGEPTGIHLTNEAKGLIPTRAWKRKNIGKNWQSGETLSIAIGQSYNLVTPIQVITMVSAIANEGTRYRPQLIKKIVTADNLVLVQNKKYIEGYLPASKKTIAIIKKGLWQAVNHSFGTGAIAYDECIQISGKTGTAQLISREKRKYTKYDKIKKHLRPHAWFIAYAPTKKPEIAVVVIVEHGESGSYAAGPLAKEIIRSYFNLSDPKTLETNKVSQNYYNY